MSHFSRIKTQMVEKEYLLLALKDAGYSCEEGEHLTVFVSDVAVLSPDKFEQPLVESVTQ